MLLTQKNALSTAVAPTSLEVDSRRLTSALPSGSARVALGADLRLSSATPSLSSDTPS